MGSLTLTTVSELIQTAPASPTISAPALWYSASGKPDCAPAWVSTSTVCPASQSAFTPAGITPTRASLSLISLGTPIFIIVPPEQPNSPRRVMSIGERGQSHENNGCPTLATFLFLWLGRDS